MCRTCLKLIKKGQPIWKHYYTGSIFCSATCAALYVGCERYSEEGDKWSTSEDYNNIFNKDGLGRQQLLTIRENLQKTKEQQMAFDYNKNEYDFRFDLDYDE
jgi:hypothetical protein